MIKFSVKQLAHMGRQSGFVIPLLASLACSFLPGLVKTGIDWVKSKIAGSGVDDNDGFNKKGGAATGR